MRLTVLFHLASAVFPSVDCPQVQSAHSLTSKAEWCG